MKRLLPAAILAVGIHACLLWTDFGWVKRKSFSKPQSRSVILTLVSRPMPKAEPAPTLSKPAMPPAPAPVSIPESKPEPEPRPAPRPTPKPDPKPQPETARVRKPEIEIAAPPPVGSKPSLILPETRPVFDSRTEPLTGKEQPDLPAALIEAEPRPRTLLKADEQKQQVSAHPIETPPAPAPVREAKPRYRDNPTPPYPILARRRGFQGTVVLDVFIDKNGRVTDMKTSSSSGYSILDKAARTTVENWLFEPGMKGEEKIEMWVKVPIRFELK
ncbi:MAG: TonB family protein [Thermodesulfobacteriota bacterium]